MTQMYDLIVIGGGPAGTSAAITAARDGRRVLLLERGKFPRHKVCGEFVSAESLSLLRWLISDGEVDRLRHASFLTQSRLMLDGRTIRVPIDPPAASIARHDLDLALWNAAVEAGVAGLQETTVREIAGGGPFLIATSHGQFSTRTVVNASGRWSNLSSPIQKSSRSRWLGLKAHFHGEMEPGVELYFFDHGYCGVQPVRGDGGETLINVCALLRPGAKLTMEEVFSSHPWLESRSHSWVASFPALSTFPVILRDPTPVTSRVLNVGDAAGFVDPFVGDGISLALRGGNMAARSLHGFWSGTSTMAQSLAQYSAVYRRALRPVYRISGRLRKFLSVPRPLRAAIASACERSPRLAAYLVEATRSRAVAPALSMQGD